MATTYTNSHAGAGLGARVAQFFAGLREAWTLRSEYNRTYGELSRLSDRELADIGLRRCDLDDIVTEHVYGRV